MKQEKQIKRLLKITRDITKQANRLDEVVGGNGNFLDPEISELYDIIAKMAGIELSIFSSGDKAMEAIYEYSEGNISITTALKVLKDVHSNQHEHR